MRLGSSIGEYASRFSLVQADQAEEKGRGP